MKIAFEAADDLSTGRFRVRSKAEARVEATRLRVEAIRRKSLRQTRLLMDEGRARGFTPRSPENDAERGGMVILDVPHGQAVTRELIRREVLVDYRPGAGIRISPHFYTSDDELRHCLDEVRDTLDSGAYAAHEQAGGTGF